MLETSSAIVGRVRERFFMQGLDAALECPIASTSAPSSVAEARLIALACSEAPEDRDRWSTRHLADKAVEMGIVESVSHETVRKTSKN
jgi:hypothetical protein